jgi:hypothetical protein
VNENDGKEGGEEDDESAGVDDGEPVNVQGLVADAVLVVHSEAVDEGVFGVRPGNRVRKLNFQLWKKGKREREEKRGKEDFQR